MITLRPGSHAQNLLTLLSITGEFPVRSLHLLGNERVIKALVHKLVSPQTIRLYQTDMEWNCQLLKINGRGVSKSLRLMKGALPILTRICPEGHAYYLSAYNNHRFPGDAAHRDRNFRVGEVVATCMSAGIECRPYLLPVLQKEQLMDILPSDPVFYLARDIKKIGPGQTEMNKTMYSRMTGALFAKDNAFAVYNTRSGAMKWSGMGEFKTKHDLIELARMNADIRDVDSAILFGESETVALKTLLESTKNRRSEFRFDGVFGNVYYVPLNSQGIRRLRMLTIPGWKQQLLDLLFDPETQSDGHGHMEFDAYVDKKYIYSHLDGNLARLIRFGEALQTETGSFEIICFPDQVHLLREYLGPRVTLKTIDIDLVECELGLDARRSLFG